MALYRPIGLELPSIRAKTPQQRR